MSEDDKTQVRTALLMAVGALTLLRGSAPNPPGIDRIIADLKEAEKKVQADQPERPEQ